MKAALKHNYIPPEVYFEMEESCEYKNEYWYGEIFAMSGASHHHNVIAVNVLTKLHSELSDTNCYVYGSDMKIQVAEDLHYVYPDISVACIPVQFAKNRKDIVANPIVIIEILSETTRDYDRGSKFTAYRNIPSLRDYILIDQYSVHVEYFHKNEYGKWVLDEYKNLDNSFIIKAIDVELSMKTIYHRVEFSSELLNEQK